MNKHICRNAIVPIAALFLLLFAGPAFSNDVIKLGIFPRKPAIETKNAYEPLAKYLSEKTGKQVEIVLSKDFPSFWQSVKNREFDLVHYNQYHYIKSHKELGYSAIAMSEEFGFKKMSPSIIVRKDSGINSVADLKGKKIMFGGNKQAMQAYIGVVHLLNKNGLKPGDYIESFAINPPNAVLAAYDKMADAAGGSEVVLDLATVRNRIDAKLMKILAKGEELPMLCWAVRKEMDKTLVMKISKAMKDLKHEPGGPEILKAAEVSAFIPASDRDYDSARRIVKETLHEQY